MSKTKSPRQIRKIRIAFRKQCNKFIEEINKKSKEISKIAEETDVLLSAMEQVAKISKES